MEFDVAARGRANRSAVGRSAVRALAAALILLGALLLFGCKRGKKSVEAPPVQVGVVVAQPVNVPLTKDLVGRLSAFRSADVRARAAGVLLKRDYKEGSEVKVGQLLFQIDPAPLKAALENANAQLAQAQATYANDKVNADRARAMAPKGYVSRSDLDNAVAAERTARAAAKAAEANVDTARINLGYASVTSPIAGQAGEQQVTEGALVGNGTATLLTTVNQLDPLYVNFTLSMIGLDEMRRAANAGGVTLSQPDKATVAVTLPDGSPYPLPGTVDFSAATVDPATGSVRLRAILPNPRHMLLPGGYVTLRAMLGERHGAFLIPQPAVLSDTGGTYVLIVGKDGKVARHDVVTAGTHGNDWVVTSGLAANDTVIVTGVQTARVGQAAKGTPWQPPAMSTSTAQPPTAPPAS